MSTKGNSLMLKALIFSVSFLLGSTLSAQSLITLLHNGQSSFYPMTRLDSAYAHSVTGDSLLLPGDVITLPIGGWVIDKSIHVIGVGHQPDSMGGVRTTVLAGEIFVLDSASGGSIQSVHITNVSWFGNSSNNEEVQDFLFLRCFFGGIFYLSYNYNSTNNGYVGNNEFRECIFGDRITSSNNYSTPCVLGQLSKGNRFLNCIFDRSLAEFGEGTLFDHCLFLGYGGLLNNYFFGCYFQNNIFLSFQTGNNPSSVYNNTFFHNLFDSNFNPPSRNIEGFNYENVSQTGLFVNKSFSKYNPSEDYHLANPSAYLGSDGTPVGIFGGNPGYKGSTASSLPKVLSKSVNYTTDSLGRLPVRIRVRAIDY